MSLITLLVLCPSGHTVQVKANPNDNIKKVMENVCKKREIASNRHAIKHKGRFLDPVTTIRFANLLNRSHLDLVEKAEAETESEFADVALRETETGKRFREKFTISTSLKNVLEKFEFNSDNGGKNPVIVFMAHEVEGWHKMEGTTLEALGICAGRSELLQLSFRAPGAKESVQSESGAGGTIAAPVNNVEDAKNADRPRRLCELMMEERFFNASMMSAKPKNPK